MSATPGDAGHERFLERLKTLSETASSAFPPTFPIDRQPVHTAYVAAHRFTADLPRRWGDDALRALDEYAPDPRSFGEAFGLDLGDELLDGLRRRVARKLETEPVEDCRLDFEDGYGRHSERAEDEHASAAGAAVAAAMESGALPRLSGLRIKAMTPGLAPRALRTLERMVSAVGERRGELPAFAVTLPKVTQPEQVAVLADVLDELESRLGLAPGVVRIEIMVESPRTLFDGEGRCPLPAIVRAARGRCIAAHLGTYDFTAEWGVPGPEQSLLHPACDFARSMMKAALTSSGVWLCDGSTGVLPREPHPSPGAGRLSDGQWTENRDAVFAAWKLHAAHVRHGLESGFTQGWDLHPLQLAARFAGLYGYFLSRAAEIRNYSGHLGDQGHSAHDEAGVSELLRVGFACGALEDGDATTGQRSE